MLLTSESAEPLSWSELASLAKAAPNLIEGPTSAQATLRLFGQPETSVNVTLYRDHHAWCPYCQKIWLWLEFKRIPYRIRKVTMRCYGPKEQWFLQKVPAGMLPALELNGQLITESDVILLALEQKFGPLGMAMTAPEALELRRLERLLFQAWCIWLCSPRLSPRQQVLAREQFQGIAQRFESELNKGEGPWLWGPEPQTVDLIFVPYVERMNASLAYYKGYRLRAEHPAIDRWFRALEELENYRGTQSDFHTHAHNLPPQMGGCWLDDGPEAQRLSERIDRGDGLGEDEACWDAVDHADQAAIALNRVVRHQKRLREVNPMGAQAFDQPLRCALTQMIRNTSCPPPSGSAAGLRYLRDRISVPRDMPLPAARLLRQALEATAQLDGPEQAKPLPVRDRFDQDPRPFLIRS